MPIRENREYRSIDMLQPEENEENKEYIIEGYALVWNEPYLLYEENGIKQYESIRRESFDESTDLSDVILLRDHEGMVYARNKNDTLQLINDEHGLKIIARLDSTEATKELYNEIKAGLYSKMSWAFIVDDEDYDYVNHIRYVNHIKKVFDVSVVARPANEATMVFTRSLIDGFIEKEKLELAKRENIEKQKQRIRILAQLN